MDTPCNGWLRNAAKPIWRAGAANVTQFTQEVFIWIARWQQRVAPDAPSSHRPLALHRHPRAGAGVRPVVPHRAVLGAAVVPEGDGVFGPAEAALEQRIFGVLVEIGQHGVALVAGNACYEAGEAAVDVERLPARHRMRAHDRMFGARIVRTVGDAVIGIEPAIGLLAVV